MEIRALLISLQHTQCAIAAGSATMSDMASISFGDHPSEPAAASSVLLPPAATNGAKSHSSPAATTNGAKSRASSVHPKDSDSDSFWCPEASDIEHCMPAFWRCWILAQVSALTQLSAE
ncbi:hypothetical protein BD769DRAFT_1390930 [Suillus cothurnatus]|nr:hypothetical protein BD769DRAFT_1390930 [Suillus cothurnatus]